MFIFIRIRLTIVRGLNAVGCDADGRSDPCHGLLLLCLCRIDWFGLAECATVLVQCTLAWLLVVTPDGNEEHSEQHAEWTTKPTTDGLPAWNAMETIEHTQLHVHHGRVRMKH